MSTATRYIRSTPFPQQNSVFGQRFGEKHSLIVLLLVSLLITLLPPASVSAGVPPMPFHQETASYQGEIAYILDGNLWLHDLVSGNARQLTSDGDNLEPNWSPDGRYLVYSRGTDLESADLYVLDVEGDGEAQLLVEQACCGAWSPDGERIAYVDLSGEEPALRAVHPDGSEEETLLDPLTYGRGAYPMGKLDWVSKEYLLAPLEIIAEGSLDIYRDVIAIDLGTQGVMKSSLTDGSGCMVLSIDVVMSTDGGGSSAMAFEQSGESCVDDDVDKGIGIKGSNDSNELVLPWLAAPSLSHDGLYLAAERYAESNSPSTATLWGVVVVNILTGAEQAVAVDAVHPAWRPAAPTDLDALYFVQPGERLVTLETPLLYNGSLYRISYVTTGSLQRRDAEVIHIASQAYFAEQEVTGLIVTKDGAPVLDMEELRQVFESYHAAYHLYVEPLPDLLPLLDEELDTVLETLLLMDMSPTEFLSSARNQNAAALRALLTVWDGEEDALALFDEVTADIEDVETALEVFGTIVNDQHKSNLALTTLHADLQKSYEASTELTEGSAFSSETLRLAAELLLLSEFQRERAAWLQTYVERFPSGGLNRDQLRATATVLAEVDEAQQQRINLVVEFIQEEATKTFLQSGAKLTPQAATDLATRLTAKYGTSLSSQAVSSLLSKISVGLTTNSILYGADDLVANFQLARRSEDFRSVFRTAAVDIQSQAEPRADTFDGNLATDYQLTVLLDTLAGIAAYHAYADGVMASEPLPDLLTIINSLHGDDWQAVAAELHRIADNVERLVLSDLVNPAMLDAAVTLALTRMQPPLLSSDEMIVEPVTGMVFVHVPAGEFLMGSADEEVDQAMAWCNRYGNCDRSWFEPGMPQHEVYLDEYWIGQTEVTNAQFQHFVDAGGYETERYWNDEGWQARNIGEWSAPRCWDQENFNAPDQPVVCISWYEAEAYTRWLSEVSGMIIRLPTEAEWEKAARGTDGRIYPWGEELPTCSLANYYIGGSTGFCVGYSSEVGSYPVGASPYGVMDMAGNVSEWVSDWYQEDYYSISPDSNPQGPATGDYRVIRGGSWSSYGGGGAMIVRSALRDNSFPYSEGREVGFRYVLMSANGLTVTPQEEDSQKALNSQTLSEKILGVWKPSDGHIAEAVYFWENGIAYAEPDIYKYSILDETTLVLEGDENPIRLDILSIDETELSFRNSDGELVTVYRYPEIENLESKLLGYWLDSAFINNNLADFDFANIEFLSNGQALLASLQLPHYFPYGAVPYQVFNNNTIVLGIIPDSIIGVLLVAGVSDHQLGIEYAIDWIEWDTYSDKSMERAEEYPNLEQSILGIWEDQDNWTYEFLESGELHSLSPSGPQDTWIYDVLSNSSVMMKSSDSSPVSYFYEVEEVSEQRIVLVPWGRLDSGDDLVLSRKTGTSTDSVEPSRTVITAQEYYDMTRDGSDYQTTQYQEGLIGAQVFESGTVQTIKTSGEVTVYMDVRYGQVFMHLDDTTSDILQELSIGDKISFSGTISYFGYSPVPANAAIHLNNVIVTAVE